MAGRGSMCYDSLEGEGDFGKNGYLYRYGLLSFSLLYNILITIEITLQIRRTHHAPTS